MIRAALLALALLLATASGASAATILVTSDNDVDDGTCAAHCSLREAIIAANATPLGSDEIVFHGAMTITPLTQLPTVLTRLTINGTTAPNCAGATEQIALDGGGGAFDGLLLGAGSDGSRICRLNIRHFENGISIGTSDGNTIEGCRIGTNPPADAAPDPNSEFGISIKGGDDNVIGGTTATERNIISGNLLGGVVIGTDGDGNLVQGNHIGVDLDGDADLGNGGPGVWLSDDSASTVGGTAAGAANVISGNAHHGVTTDEGTVLGNRIGTDAAGVAAIPNSFGGVLVEGPSTVGGPTPEARNVISGNAGNQVDVEAPAAATIEGNWIGPNALEDPLTSTGSGIDVLFATGLTIAGNVIAGHTDNGITLSDTITNPVIEDNLVGRLPDGTPVPGGDVGIDVGTDTTGADVERNTVTAHDRHGIEVQAAGSVIEDNLITGNGGDGISVDAFAEGTALFVNRIHGNGGLGIDLLDDGVTANDPGDGDTELTNFPELASAVTDGAGTTVSGTLDTVAGRTYSIEVFSNGTCDPAGHGEGEEIIAAGAVTAGSGPTPFTISGAATAAGRQIAATATDLTSLETSELSACRTATAPATTTITPPVTTTPAPPPVVLPPAAPAPKFPAKLRVLRNGVDDGVLDMLIEVTSRAVTPGAAFSIDYHSSGRHTRFTVPITGTQVKVRKRLPSTQPKDTGITTVTYAGNAVVDPDEARLRAADGKSLLTRSSSSLIGGRLSVAGTVTSSARGVVRIRMSYAKADGSTGFLDWNAPISGGRWSLAQALTGDAVRGGHLSVQFTGYEARGLRGEQTSKAVP